MEQGSNIRASLGASALGSAPKPHAARSELPLDNGLAVVKVGRKAQGKLSQEGAPEEKESLPLTSDRE